MAAEERSVSDFSHGEGFDGETDEDESVGRRQRNVYGSTIDEESLPVLDMMSAAPVQHLEGQCQEEGKSLRVW